MKQYNMIFKDDTITYLQATINQSVRISLGSGTVIEHDDEMR
jgi:hypothetical protein